MRYLSLKKRLAGLFILRLTVSTAQSAGLLKPANGTQSTIEIRNHKVTVVIENGYAITTVDQVFLSCRSLRYGSNI